MRAGVGQVLDQRQIQPLIDHAVIAQPWARQRALQRLGQPGLGAAGLQPGG